MIKHKRPTGHWVRYKINSNQSECLICSNCGSYSDPNKILDFCLTCGADMRNKRDNNEIRWIDKLSVKSNGDIIDFEGKVVGHIDLNDVGK